MSGNNGGRESVAQMIAALMREAGVLILVFEVFAAIWDVKTTVEAHHMWINAAMGVNFIIGGIVLERKRGGS